MEVVEVDDLYTSPVPPKIMNSLRPTKSEENLGLDVESYSAFTMCGSICDENDPDWSQEDDEISRQVIVACNSLKSNNRRYYFSILS